MINRRSFLQRLAAMLSGIVAFNPVHAAPHKAVLDSKKTLVSRFLGPDVPDIDDLTRFESITYGKPVLWEKYSWQENGRWYTEWRKDGEPFCVEDWGDMRAFGPHPTFADPSRNVRYNIHRVGKAL